MQLWHIFTFLFLTILASHAALPSEVYWKVMLPKTPMPKAVKELLPSEWKQEKTTSVVVGHGGSNIDAGKWQSGGNGDAGNGQGGGNDNAGNGQGGGNTDAGTGNQGGGTSVNVGHNGGGVSVSTGHHRGKPIYVGVGPGSQPFLYNYAATKDQLHDNPNVALFFLEKDLHQGTKMNLHFLKSSNEVKFLPRQVADSIPFSSNKMPEILNKFLVDANSMQAEVMKKTIKECKESSIKGEEKYCATSLESMVDFTTSKLGTNIEAISTEVEKGNNQLQRYSFSGIKKMSSEEAVVCHRQKYPYAVFYCHKTEAIKAYLVSMAASDGTKVKAVAVCHKDTSAWNPRHLAFQVLKVKPGTVPICHFLPEDHLVWVPK